jgi:alkaline phosphatase
MVRLFIFFLLAGLAGCISQEQHYTTANAHSHNDYEQKRPFYEAWENEFGSIEADIFLYEGKLVVAHDSVQLLQQRTLDSLYLKPLQLCVERNGGYVYADRNRSLQLMIDIKSDSVKALDKLVETLQKFPALISSSSLKIVISGNRPAPRQFSSYPEWILFDGELQRDYQPAAMQKIVMLSDNFAHYSNWGGAGEIPVKDREALKEMIEKAHDAGKKIRFWNAPDNPEAWKVFMEMGADYLNTDKIDGLSKFLK